MIFNRLITQERKEQNLKKKNKTESGEAEWKVKSQPCTHKQEMFVSDHLIQLLHFLDFSP